MFNGSDLLGSLLQGGGPRGRATGRLEHAMGDRGLGGSGGPLGQILGGLGGASGSPGHQGTGGGGILGSLAGMLGGGSPGGIGGALGGGTGGRPVGRDLMAGGLGALAASVLSGRGGGAGGLGSAMGGLGRGNMRGAVGAGGLALLGMLAMNALKNAGNRQQPAAPGLAEDSTGGLGAGYAGAADQGAQEMPPERALSDQTASLVVRAMIDAAKADGRVDANERQRILAKAQENGADEESSAFLQRELERPADPDGLAAEARDPVVAAQVYAASLLAIEVDSQEERDYLRSLAGKLNLGPQVVAQLHSVLGAPPA